MKKRTFGWVQNPNRLETLKNVVGVLEYNSESNLELLNNKFQLLTNNSLADQNLIDKFKKELSVPNIEISYENLKGKGAPGKSRKEAKCSGIVQAAINATLYINIIDDDGNLQKIKKPYTDDWTADGYLRWGISTGLIDYNKEKDTCEISELGKELVNSPKDSDEEREAFTKALLSYPPVVRVLEILSEGEQCTKFDIGRKLGFIGEKGFTSIPQNMFVADYCTAPNQTKKKEIRSNVEGDSDKYARTIANWLLQMGWVTNPKKEVTETYCGITYHMTMASYRITLAGKKALKLSKGYSSNAKISKIIMFEMLATKVPNVEYIRLRRAHIIKYIEGKERSIEEIQQYLESVNLKDSINTIEDDIGGLKLIGINIESIAHKFKITDKIKKLEVPKIQSIVKEDITKIKDIVRDKLKTVNHKYLILVDLAYSDAASKRKKNSDAREFEIQTAELLTKELNFNGERLGDAGKPDLIISYGTKGIIIDNKSYKDGFNVDGHCSDEMNRYIEQNQQRIPNVPTNEWWKRFDTKVREFYFLFVTSYLKGNFKTNIQYLSTMRGIKGGAIGVDNLLYLAESLKSGEMDYNDFFIKFNNDEIKI